LPPEKVTQILESLGFESKRQKDGTLKIGIPAFRSRKDISIPEDIVEEVLRVYGYDNIPPVLPAVPVAPLNVEVPIKMGHKIRRMLTTAHRFLEVHNYVWFNDNWLKALEYVPEETLVLKNPTTPETSRLRTTLLPNLLALIPKNRPFRKSFRLFEIGRTFFPLPKHAECIEKHHLAGLAYQHAGAWEEFYLSVKFAVESVLSTCGLQDVVFKEQRADDGVAAPVWQSPGNYVTIYSGEKPLGTLGILDKSLTAKVCREGGQIVWFEIDLNDVTATLYPEAKFDVPPEYPLSWQDFSLLWKIEDGFDKLESLLDRFANPLMICREFLVSHRGKDLDKNTACYSFRFWIGSPDHTLSGEEIESFHQQFLTYIKDNGIALRM
jgi:phenylalanyl-tRNA synthetase beta chain